MMVVTPKYKPSEVVLAVPPLCGTMKKAEVEFAASIVVAACHHFGDKWQPLALKELGVAIRELLEAKAEPWNSLNTNPFFRPDIGALIESPFAEKGDDGRLSFTMEGFEALKRWVRGD